MNTNDVAQMLCKPARHLGLICHIIYIKCKIKSEENTALSKYLLYNFCLILEKA